LTKRNFAIELK